jgi:hypothetical protein
MPITPFFEGYPPDGASLGQTKSTIRGNLDGTFQTLSVDHINNNGQPGSKPAGYHTVIHEVSQTSVNTVVNYNQVFSGIPGTLVVNSVTTPTIPPGGDTQLYSLSGAGVLSQLTGSVQSANGYAWIGGILLQWGGSVIGSGIVNFPITFPTGFFNIQMTLSMPVANPPSQGTIVYTQGTPTSFNYKYSGSGNIDTFFWLAIGN